MTDPDTLIDTLRLSPHPEGGWYRETWRGPMIGGRASGTAILFLLKAGERSHWHRVDADEIWLWHAGAPLTLRIAATEGAATKLRLGPDVPGETPQAVVPSGHWQAAETTGEFTLVSCTVSPGFRFDGFTLAPPDFAIPDACDPDAVMARAFPGQEARVFAPMSIGSSPESRDHGAALILSGVKTATSALPSDYATGPAPFVGALSAVLDGAGRVVGVVETVEVVTLPFGEVTEPWAADYGEGDRTRAWFRAEIGGWYAAEAAARGETWGEASPLVFERFRLVRRFDRPGP